MRSRLGKSASTVDHGKQTQEFELVVSSLHDTRVAAAGLGFSMKVSCQ